jgi:hypothetical protein
VHAQRLQDAGLDPKQQKPEGVSLEEIRRIACEEVLHYARKHDTDSNGLLGLQGMQDTLNELKQDIIPPESPPATPTKKQAAATTGSPVPRTR